MSTFAPQAAQNQRRGEITPLAEILKDVAPQGPLVKLEEVGRAWGSVVGPNRARGSVPYDLAGRTLHVAAASNHLAGQIVLMKGNIRRVLRERWGIELDELKVIVGQPPVRRVVSSTPRRRRPAVEPDEGAVRAFRVLCPPSLPPETADALARLRAFFAKRFPRAGE